DGEVVKQNALYAIICGFVALGLLALASCATSTRTKTLHATLTGVESASRALLAYDKVHELELVDAAKDKPSAQAAILGWHQKRDGVQAGIIAAFEAIAVAETMNDDPSLAGAVKSLADLKQLLAALGIK